MELALTILAISLVVPLLTKFVLLWIVVPLRIKRKNTLKVQRDFEQTTLEHLTPEIQEFIGMRVRQFTAQGFEVVTNTYHYEEGVRAHSVQVLLVNRETNDLGTIIVVQALNNRSLVFFITSEFADSMRIRTGFNPKIGVFPRDPMVDSISIAWTNDVSAICEFHRRRVKASNKAELSRVVPAAGTELEYLQQVRDRELHRCVKDGYMFIDEAAGVYHKTIKGAFLMTWKMLRPIKPLRIALRDRNARKLWRQMAMDQWQAPPHETSTAARVIPSPVPVEDPLNYQPVLRNGEIRREQSGKQLVVRIGVPTRGQYLLQNWISFIWIAIFGFLTLQAVLYEWMIYRYIPSLPKSTRLQWIEFWPVVLILLIARELFRLFRPAMRIKGTVTLTASSEGLTFHNAMTRPSSGQIRREEVGGILLRFRRGLIWRRTYGLELKKRNDKRILLVEARDSAALQSVRGELMRAMGIERDTSQSSASTEPTLHH